MSTFKPPLTSGDGYAIVIGFGAAFTIGMIGTTMCLRRYHGEDDTSEGFSTANRTVKSGLIASAVVSSWTWAATLLQSSTVAYEYGVSGPLWYAAGATVQIVLFCVLAIELKRRAPFAHTFLEVVRARYGTAGHVVFIIFCLSTNILVTSMLLTGGSSTVSGLTGMNVAAACFLLPLSCILYTLFGGIKATFLTDYAHTVILIIIILYFALTAYAGSSLLGSPSAMYNALQAAAERHPVVGNAEGSYLTMRSQQGGIFFVINIIGNFGTVFLDNGYYNKAISASPISALPGYLLGGLAWFAVPFLAATTLGLSAVALENSTAFPTYPFRLAPSDVTAGLALPAAATALLGKSGAVACTIMVFMAVTSAMSAQLIAVSSILTYDIFKTYIRPQASGKTLIRVSHAVVVLFGVIMSGWAVALYYINVSMGYLYLLMGVIISSAVIPGALTLLWKRQSKLAACASPPLGFVCSMVGWLVTTKTQFGEITVASSGSNIPMLVGNVVALLSPIIFVPILSLVKRETYDFASMRSIRKIDDTELVHVDPEALPTIDDDNTERDIALLTKNSRFARITAVIVTLCLLILWPMPMYGSGYVFSRPFFTGWVVVGIIWLFMSFGIVGIFPLYEGRKAIALTLNGIRRDLTGRGHLKNTLESSITSRSPSNSKDGESEKIS